MATGDKGFQSGTGGQIGNKTPKKTPAKTTTPPKKAAPKKTVAPKMSSPTSQKPASTTQRDIILDPAMRDALSRTVTATTRGTGMGSRTAGASTPTASKPGPGTTTNVTQPPAQPLPPAYANWEEAAKELYGGYYSIVQSVPELQDLLKKAYQNGWSETKFDYELRQTSWWKQNSESARAWDVSSQLDPADAQQKIEARVASLRNIALSQYQVEISDSVLRKLATDSLRSSWTEQMVQNAIGLEATRTPGGMSSLASGFIGQNLKATAADYGIRLSNEQFNQWVTGIATGNQTNETFQSYLVNSAKTLFPGISTQLDSGQTYRQVVEPYMNAAAQILEIEPQTIDFLDPRWAKAVTYVAPNGEQRPMNYNEWGDYLRQDRSFGYEYTSQAQQKAYEVANELANLFGKV